MYTPFVSVITPTFNSEAVIGECLEAVASQDYPKDRLEVVIADAGSTDRTLEIVRSFYSKLDIIITGNPLKTGEAGKSVAIERSKGEILALIDSDNIMPHPEFIRQMTAPFAAEPDIMGTEPLFFEYRKKDRPLTRYFAMSGINDPLCLFIGNYDRYSYITGKWTGFNLPITDKETYFVISLDEKRIPTIGANGTFMKREHLLKANYKPYLFDIDAVYEIMKKGVTKFAKVKTGIVHIYSPDLGSFVKKQKRRINDFLHFEKNSQRTYPWASFPAKGIIIFTLYCLTVLPLLLQAAAGFVRKRTWEWVFHPVVCYVTLFIYGWSFISTKLTGKTGVKGRDRW